MKRIGRYDVLSMIGRGATGSVYLAQDPALRRRVAVKVLLAPCGVSPAEEVERRRRFLREAQTAGGLSHPGIVTIYEVAEDPESGLLYIAMEHVPGRSLQEILETQGSLSPSRTLRMALALADALHVAHSQGIVHRDIKPANVLVRDVDQAIKLLDFGIARLPLSDLTRSGATMGSPAYTSPEQVKGDPVDGRSDLFSLAVILYQSLTGRRPFSGEDLPALTYSIVHREPLALGEHVVVPQEVEVFFRRALAKNPEDRWPSGVAFATALREAFASFSDPDQVLAGKTHREAPVIRRLGPRLAPRWIWAFALVPCLLATLLWIVGNGASSEPLPNAAAVATQGDGEPSSVERASTAPSPARPTQPVAASFQLVGESSVKAGTLDLIVDGDKVYSRQLSTESRAVRRFFKKMGGKARESFEATVRLSPGEHEVVARLTLPDGRSFEDATTLDLTAARRRVVRVSAGGVFGKRVSIDAD